MRTTFLLLAGAASACSTAGQIYMDAEEMTCMPGTPDHCTMCGAACPGVDNAGTLRTCTNSTCSFSCKGEYYDLNGDMMDGCEAEDLPIQDSSLLAVSIVLPDVNNGGTGAMPCNDATNPCTKTARIYSDTRKHENAPTNRPLGREDWFKVTANGAGSPNNVGACLGITNFPTDNQYEICISNSGSSNPTTCMTAQGGGTSACVSPPATSTGVFYLKVRKIAGMNTSNDYALYLVH
jgi:hypothetical protein